MTVFECGRCGYSWYPRKPEKPKVCPVCKSPYWDTPRKYKLKELNKRGTSMISKTCPVCGQEYDSYLNVARHMVMKDRPNGEHQLWLQDLLNREFPEYAFKHDRDIANALRKYWNQHRL